MRTMSSGPAKCSQTSGAAQRGAEVGFCVCVCARAHARMHAGRWVGMWGRPCRHTHGHGQAGRACLAMHMLKESALTVSAINGKTPDGEISDGGNITRRASSSSACCILACACARAFHMHTRAFVRACVCACMSSVSHALTLGSCGVGVVGVLAGVGCWCELEGRLPRAPVQGWRCGDAGRPVQSSCGGGRGCRAAHARVADVHGLMGGSQNASSRNATQKAAQKQ